MGEIKKFHRGFLHVFLYLCTFYDPFFFDFIRRNLVRECILEPEFRTTSIRQIERARERYTIGLLCSMTFTPKVWWTFKREVQGGGGSNGNLLLFARSVWIKFAFGRVKKSFSSTPYRHCVRRAFYRVELWPNQQKFLGRGYTTTWFAQSLIDRVYTALLATALQLLRLMELKSL